MSYPSSSDNRGKKREWEWSLYVGDKKIRYLLRHLPYRMETRRFQECLQQGSVWRLDLNEISLSMEEKCDESEAPTDNFYRKLYNQANQNYRKQHLSAKQARRQISAMVTSEYRCNWEKSSTLRRYAQLMELTDGGQRRELGTHNKSRVWRARTDPQVVQCGHGWESSKRKHRRCWTTNLLKRKNPGKMTPVPEGGFTHRG